MENPCIDCLCVPSCKNKLFNRLLIDCDLINKYLDEMESFVPLDSYRYITLRPLNHKYEIRKDWQGNCRWFKEKLLVGTSTHVSKSFEKM